MNDNGSNAPENKKKKKKSSGGALFIILIIILAAILLFIWKFGPGGFGAGSGGDSIGNNSDSYSDTAISESDTSASESDVSDPADNDLVKIIVSDGNISANGENMSDSGALKEFLLSVNDENTKYVLTDDRALKSAYDEAKAVLDELGYEYSERTEDQSNEQSEP